MIKQINLKKLNKKISLIYKDNSYYFKGPLGEIKLNSNYFVSPYKEKKIFINSKKLNSFINSIKNSFISVSYGWFLELNLKGIGFKCFKIDDKIALDLGYSNIITFKPTKSLKIKNLKNRLILFSVDKNYLTNVAQMIKYYSILDLYKGKGLFLKTDKIILKKKKI